MDKQEIAKQVVDGMLERDEFSRWLKTELLELRPGYCKLSMSVRDEMLNGFKVCHGGIPFSLADSALAFASNSYGQIAMSIENGMAYLTPVYSGDTLTAVAEEEAVSNRIGTYTVTITNQDDVKIGIFRGTVYRTSKEHLNGE